MIGLIKYKREIFQVFFWFVYTLILAFIVIAAKKCLFEKTESSLVLQREACAYQSLERNEKNK
jgi:hypothetical protein